MSAPTIRPQLPRIGLGTAGLGSVRGVLRWEPVPESQAIDTVHFALENGVTHLDTAPYYDRLQIEVRLGRALAGIPRSTYTLSTKVGRPEGTDPTDFSRAAVLRSIEGSLSRLKIDRLDVVLLHDPDENNMRLALDEGYPTLLELHTQGVVGAVGVGVNGWEILMRMADEAVFDFFMLAGRYTLLEQGALNALNTFHTRGIGLLAAGVYNSGILAQGLHGTNLSYQYVQPPEHILTRVGQLEAVCQQFNVPLHAAAVQFVMAHPAVNALVIGAQSPAQLQMTLDGARVEIPAAFWATLLERDLIDPKAPVPSASSSPSS